MSSTQHTTMVHTDPTGAALPSRNAPRRCRWSVCGCVPILTSTKPPQETRAAPPQTSSTSSNEGPTHACQLARVGRGAEGKGQRGLSWAVGHCLVRRWWTSTREGSAACSSSAVACSSDCWAKRNCCNRCGFDSRVLCELHVGTHDAGDHGAEDHVAAKERNLADEAVRIGRGGTQHVHNASLAVRVLARQHVGVLIDPRADGALQPVVQFLQPRGERGRGDRRRRSRLPRRGNLCKQEKALRGHS